MYVYEGEDYSKCSNEDKKSFDQLLAGIYVLVSNAQYPFFCMGRHQVHASVADTIYNMYVLYLVEQLKLSESELGERVLRSEHQLPATTSLELTAVMRKRKPLTPEQLEERRKKVCNVLD